MNGPASPLTGRRILVTRPQERGDALLDRAVAAGARIEHRPAIGFEPPDDPESAERAVLELEKFQWLVLTSPAGVRFFLERLRNSGAGPVPEAVRIAVVGPGTAAAVREVGYRPALIASRATSDGLAADLAGQPIEGARVLWVRPEIAGPGLGATLTAAGARVTAAVFYKTVPDPACPGIAADLAAGRYHGVLFTSPSTFRGVFDAVRPADRERFDRVIKVAIGKVTGAAMEAAGCPPEAIAREPTGDGVAEAFEAAFGPAALC